MHIKIIILYTYNNNYINIHIVIIILYTYVNIHIEGYIDAYD